MIECLQLSKSHGSECELFRGATLRVKKGEIVAISGAAGCGKTTLVRILMAMESPDAGQVLIQGRNVHEMSGRLLSALRRRMGIVAQNGRLAPEWTVFDNVALPLILTGKDRWFIQKRVHQVLASLNLQGKAHLRCHALGTSEKRRVEIARAAVHHPLILLADEPFQGLEPSQRPIVAALLEGLCVGGSTIVILSREPAETLGAARGRRVRIAHRVFVEGLPSGEIPAAFGALTLDGGG